MAISAAAEEWTTPELLVMAGRLVQRAQDRALAELGLTHTAVTALQGLATGPQSQDRLAARVGVRAPTIGTILARLDAAGLITRARDPRNGRKIQAALTRSGKTALEKARHIQQHLQPLNFPPAGTLRDELLTLIAALAPPAAPPPVAGASRNDSDPDTERTAQADSNGDRQPHRLSTG